MVNAMAEERVRVNGVEIVYETIGEPTDTPLLLVMGLGSSWGSECS
jgi:hypothetical protein